MTLAANYFSKLHNLVENVIQPDSHKRQIEYGYIVCLNREVICQNLKRKPHFNIYPI